MRVRSKDVLQVHTLARAADRVRSDLVQIGAKEAVIRAKIKFIDDNFVTVLNFLSPLFLRTPHGETHSSTFKLENIF